MRSGEAKSSNLDELEKLAALRDKGTITEDEFQAKKKQILGLWCRGHTTHESLITSEQ